MKDKINAFLAHPLWRDHRVLMGLWFVLAVVSAITKLKPERCNNFLIFKGTFWHAYNGTSLYEAYPAEYFDINHYGPFFSLVIAPFAVVPHFLGLLAWTIALTAFLYVAIRWSQFSQRQQLFLLWFCAHELLTALFMQQFNIAIAAIIVLTYYCIEREKDFWAAFFIMLGHKGKFIGSLILWAVIMFVAPMVFHGPDYTISQYQEWFTCLIGKNDENLASIAQNISLLGLVHRTTGLAFSDLWLIVPGLVLFALPYLRFSQYQNMAFRQTLLASVLMFVVLFSTGSESNGYITPFVGVVIWYTAAPWQRTRWDIALMIFVFVLSSLSPSDLFPAYLRKEWVQPYALKALPVTLVWFKLCYEIITKDYKPITQKAKVTEPTITRA